MQTERPLTHSIKTQASPMMVTARVQTSPEKVKYYVKPREEFNTESYLPAQRIRDVARRPRDTVRESDFSRLQEQLDDKRGDIRMLRQMLREKDEAIARQNADLKNMKRELSRQSTRHSKSMTALAPQIQEAGHDISINLKEGKDDDAYGQIQQVIFNLKLLYIIFQSVKLHNLKFQNFNFRNLNFQNLTFQNLIFHNLKFQNLKFQSLKFDSLKF